MTQTDALEWTIGDRIAKCRKALGMSREEFGELFDRSEKTVWLWENDESRPRDVLAFAENLAEIMRSRELEVTATYIAFGRKVPILHTAERNPRRRRSDTPAEDESNHRNHKAAA